METILKTDRGSQIPLLIMGFIIEVDDLKRSKIRYNYFQKVTIATPIFDSDKFFQYRFNYHEVLFFGEDKMFFAEDLIKDSMKGNYVKIVGTGNRKSNDGLIDEDSFIVGETMNIKCFLISSN